jgi:hypothetical protein
MTDMYRRKKLDNPTAHNTCHTRLHFHSHIDQIRTLFFFHLKDFFYFIAIHRVDISQPYISCRFVRSQYRFERPGGVR